MSTAARAVRLSRRTRTVRPAAGSTRRVYATTSLAFPSRSRILNEVEWDDLCKDKLYNEVRRGAEASLVTSTAPMAAHTGQLVTFSDMLECKTEFAPDVEELNPGHAAPILIDTKSKCVFLFPQPGIIRDRGIPV